MRMGRPVRVGVIVGALGALSGGGRDDNGPEPGPMYGKPSQDGMRGGPPRQGGMPGNGQGIKDAHSAGAQRSDPKVTDPDDYPVSGHGSRGDVRRVNKLVRCVRTAR